MVMVMVMVMPMVMPLIIEYSFCLYEYGKKSLFTIFFVVVHSPFFNEILPFLFSRFKTIFKQL